MLTHQDKVTGVYYARRSGRSDRISLWLSSAEREIAKEVESEWMRMLADVNATEFPIGTPSFTSHRKETSHAHRGERSERAGERGGSERPERGDRDRPRGSGGFGSGGRGRGGSSAFGGRSERGDRDWNRQ